MTAATRAVLWACVVMVTVMARTATGKLCKGEAQDRCGNVTNATACDGVALCRWDTAAGGACTFQARPCKEFLTQAKCAAVAGCAWADAMILTVAIAVACSVSGVLVIVFVAFAVMRRRAAARSREDLFLEADSSDTI
jgi:hypothetical protein